MTSMGNSRRTCSRQFDSYPSTILRSQPALASVISHPPLETTSTFLYCVQSVVDGLLLWGWALLGRAEKLGSSALLSSGVLEILAAERCTPPEDWRDPVFRLLYKGLVVHGGPGDSARLLRLMAAMAGGSGGRRAAAPSGAWWDRFLQDIYYRQWSSRVGKEGLTKHEFEEIRQAARDLVGTSKSGLIRS